MVRMENRMLIIEKYLNKGKKEDPPADESSFELIFVN